MIAKTGVTKSLLELLKLRGKDKQHCYTMNVTRGDLNRVAPDSKMKQLNTISSLISTVREKVKMSLNNRRVGKERFINFMMRVNWSANETLDWERSWDSGDSPAWQTVD